MNSTKNESNQGLGEPDAHKMMRRAKHVTFGLLVTAVLATIFLLIFVQPAAYLAAIPIPVLLVVFFIVSYFERNSRAEVLRKPGQAGISKKEINMDEKAAGLYTALGIGLLIATGTFIIAAALFEWAMVGVAAAALFLIFIYTVNIPFLYLAISESADDEREKATSSDIAMENEPDRVDDLKV